MNFQYPGTSLFTPDGIEVVAWSVEEFESLKGQGYTDEKPAVVEPAIEQIAEASPKPKRGAGKAVVPSFVPPDEAA